MPEHGDCDWEAQKWYCGYWMNEKEWFDIHDYSPPALQEYDAREPVEEQNEY